MPLKIAVIQGTSRQKRKSIHASKYVFEVGQKIDGIEVIFVDPLDFDLPFDGNDDEVKDPRYSKIVEESDGFFIVTPEYNHSFPSSLKRLLDSELKKYIHKPVAFAGVSSGNWGGVRAIESLVPVVRELGLVATFKDIQFPNVGDLFDDNGQIKNIDYVEYVRQSYEELIWMAKALKWGRENI